MAAGVVNIRRDVDDKFYRYRMPLLLTKIEGKGNGIKTVVPNMSDIARALSRPPTYPIKFFGCELGAQTSFDEKSDRYIVNGAHDAARLRELLDGFIKKFVLCESCKNPETDLIVTDGDIIRDCKACGQRTSVDTRHKLATFIFKNPPKRSKKVREAGTANGGNGSPPVEDADAAGGESDDELTRRIKIEAAELAADPASTAMKADDWSVDTSAEAVKARVKALETKMQAGLVLNGDDDSDDGADNPYTQIGRWAEENRDTITPVDVYKHAQDLGIEKKHKTAQVLVQALFTRNIDSEIPGFAAMFLKMGTSEKHQKAILGGVERFVGVLYPDLVSAIPKILMAFYQADLLEEQIIKHWATHVSKKYVTKDISKQVRKASEPFLKWLEEADDDENESEEEEEE
ncbi:hypothetical protein M0805_006592 [Coniferiporia weirii]|nr:hypothetical protein M0805_006592 [Coniferiporia weirii]